MLPSLFNLSAAVGGGDVSGEEREMRLPSGVIPFQTQSDVGLNTQKVRKKWLKSFLLAVTLNFIFAFAS